MRRRRYPSNLTDPQWALLVPHIPPAKAGGRPRTTDMRAVVDAILYLLRTGCQWRLLPAGFPPWSTVRGRQARRAGRHVGPPCGVQIARRPGAALAVDPNHRRRCRTREPHELRRDGWDLRIIRRGERAFKVVGLTWIVERTFAWLGFHRRLAKEYGYRVQTAETLIDIAAIRLMLNRIAPP